MKRLPPLPDTYVDTMLHCIRDGIAAKLPLQSKAHTAFINDIQMTIFPSKRLDGHYRMDIELPMIDTVATQDCLIAARAYFSEMKVASARSSTSGMEHDHEHRAYITRVKNIGNFSSYLNTKNPNDSTHIDVEALSLRPARTR